MSGPEELQDESLSAKCASCGVPYTKHLGLQGTCAELVRVKKMLLERDTALFKVAAAYAQLKEEDGPGFLDVNND